MTSKVSQMYGGISRMLDDKAAAHENATRAESRKLSAMHADADPVAIPPNYASRPEKALACLRRNGGQATDAQMRVAMGLTERQYPSSWLAPEVKRGEAHKDGEYWRLGPKPAKSSMPADAPKAVDVPAPVVTPKHQDQVADAGKMMVFVPAEQIPEAAVATPAAASNEAADRVAPVVTPKRDHIADVTKMVEPELMAAMPITDAGEVQPGAMTFVQRIPDMGIPASKTPEAATKLGKTETKSGKTVAIPQEAEPIAPAMLELDPVNLARPARGPDNPEMSSAEFRGRTALASAITPHAVDPDRFAQDFACAFWSNGALQLRRRGLDLAILSREELDHMRQFLVLVAA